MEESKVRMIDWGKLKAEYEDCIEFIASNVQDMSIAQAKRIARAMGLRKSTDRVELAIYRDELPRSRGGGKNEIDGNAFKVWLERELKEDLAEDNYYISLPEARAIARQQDLEDANNAVLVALLNLEIDGASQEGNQWRIPRDAFDNWLAEQAGSLDLSAFEDVEVEEPAEPEKNRANELLGIMAIVGLLTLLILGWLASLL